jgi:prepilin-type processing-associated H-X9-DG protein
VKQIALGMMQYTQDYDERYPLAGYHPLGDTATSTVLTVWQTNTSMPGARLWATGGNYITWMDLIFPYVKSVQIFTCPSFFPAGTAAWQQTSSYGYNWGISNFNNAAIYYNGGTSPENTANADIPLTLGGVRRPSETFLITEDKTGGGWMANPNTQQLYAKLSGNTQMTPHLDGANAAFADGHVKWISGAQMRAIPASPATCYPKISGLHNVNQFTYCGAHWNPYLD